MAGSLRSDLGEMWCPSVLFVMTTTRSCLTNVVNDDRRCASTACVVCGLTSLVSSYILCFLFFFFLFSFLCCSTSLCVVERSALVGCKGSSNPPQRNKRKRKRGTTGNTIRTLTDKSKGGGEQQRRRTEEKESHSLTNRYTHTLLDPCPSPPHGGLQHSGASRTDDPQWSAAESTRTMATTATTNASVLPLCCTREDTPCACCQRWMAYIESRERELQQQHHQQLHSHTAVWPPHVDFGDALDIECCPLESLDAVTRSGDPSMDHRHVGVTSVVSAPSSHSHDDTCMTDGHHSHSHHGHGHGHGHDHGTSSSITCDSPPASCQWPPMGASFLDLCPTTPALSLCVSTACVPTLNLSQQLLAQQNGGNVSSGSSGEVGTFSGTSSGLANALQQAAAQTSTSSGNVNSSNMTDQQQQQQQVLFHHHHHGGLPASAAHVHCTEEQALMATGNDAQRAAHIHTKACNPQVHYQFSTNNVIHDHTMPLLGVSSPVKEEDGSSASSSGLTSVSNSTIASGLMSNGLKFDPSLYPTKASVVVAGTQSSTTTSTPFLPCSRVHTFPAPFRFHPYGVGPPVPSRATLSAVHHQTSSNEEEKNKNSSNGNNTNMLNTSAASGVTPLQASSSLSTSTTSTMTSALSSNSNVSTPTNSKNGFHTPSSNAPSVSASSAASAVVASIGAISNGVGMSSIPSSSTSMSTASSSSMNAGIGGSIGGVGGLNFASSSTPVSNCHQCKVKKYSATVIQCTAVHEVTVRRSKPMCCVQKKKCAKKYCTTCLAKHYGVQIEQLNRAKSDTHRHTHTTHDIHRAIGGENDGHIHREC